jgi:hypothetical protein
VRIPEPGVLLPETRAGLRRVELPAAGVDRARERAQLLGPALRDQRRLASGADRLDERAKGGDEGGHALRLEALGHGGEVDAHLSELRQDLACPVDRIVDPALGMPVVEVRLERRRRQRVHRLRPDERLDVVDVGVGSVLRRGARPERPLRARAFACEER